MNGETESSFETSVIVDALNAFFKMSIHEEHITREHDATPTDVHHHWLIMNHSDNDGHAFSVSVHQSGLEPCWIECQIVHVEDTPSICGSQFVVKNPSPMAACGVTDLVLRAWSQGKGI